MHYSLITNHKVLQHDDIHEVARALGFVACGVQHLHLVPDDEMARLDDWLARGCAGEMQYIHRYREIRRDATLLLPGARTIISLAMSYTQRVLIKGFARYAYGRDYHEVLRRRANELVERLHIGQARVCVDTAPLLERYWAVQCGVGWIGRNRQLVVPRVGAEVLLCEVLCTDDVDRTDHPVKPRCGSCRRCIDACPTGALSDKGVDARRCNSYLTIEHRGAFGDYCPSAGCLYGCNDCTLACPWQRFAQPTHESELLASPELLAMRDDDWRKLTEKQFSLLFRHSAVKRARYVGLRRNIMQALGDGDEGVGDLVVDND